MILVSAGVLEPIPHGYRGMTALFERKVKSKEVRILHFPVGRQSGASTFDWESGDPGVQS